MADFRSVQSSGRQIIAVFYEIKVAKSSGDVRILTGSKLGNSIF